MYLGATEYWLNAHFLIIIQALNTISEEETIEQKEGSRTEKKRIREKRR